MHQGSPPAAKTACNLLGAKGATGFSPISHEVLNRSDTIDQ